MQFSLQLNNIKQTTDLRLNSVDNDDGSSADICQLQSDVQKFADKIINNLNKDNYVTVTPEEKDNLRLQLNKVLSANPDTIQLIGPLSHIFDKSNNIAKQVSEMDKILDACNVNLQRLGMNNKAPSSNFSPDDIGAIQDSTADLSQFNQDNITTIANLKDKLMKELPQELSDFNTLVTTFIDHFKNISAATPTRNMSLTTEDSGTSKNATAATLPSSQIYYVSTAPVQLVELAVAVLIINENTTVAQLNSNLAEFANNIINALISFQGFATTMSSFYNNMLNMLNVYNADKKNPGPNSQTTLSWNDPKMAVYFGLYLSLNPGAAKGYVAGTNSQGNFMIGMPESAVPPFLLPYCQPASSSVATQNYTYQYYQGAKDGTVFDISLPPYVNSDGQLVVSVYAYEYTPPQGGETTGTETPDGTFQAPIKLGSGDTKEDQYKNATIDLSTYGGPDDLKLSEVVNSSGKVKTSTGSDPYHTSTPTPSSSGSSLPPAANMVYITSATLVSAVSFISNAIGLVIPGYDLAGSWSGALESSSMMNNFLQQLAQALQSITSTLQQNQKGVETCQSAIQKMLANYGSYLQTADSKNLYNIQ